MTQLTKNLMCIQMRSGVELWVEGERVAALQRMLETMAGHKFVNFDNQSINTADIVGIFSAATMEDVKRRKNGQWQCGSGKWHDRGSKCECLPIEDVQLYKRRHEAIENCKLGCKNGYILVGQTATMCKCVSSVMGITGSAK